MESSCELLMRVVVVVVVLVSYHHAGRVEPLGGSGVDLEGQQLLRVHVVEGVQVGQLEQQLGKHGRVAGRVVLGDQAAQRPDQSLLQSLHRVHVLDARAICTPGEGGSERVRERGSEREGVREFEKS